MVYGYARVSTIGQSRDGNSLEEQTAALTEYGCQEIVTEAFTGKTVERPALRSFCINCKAAIHWSLQSWTDLPEAL